MLNTHSVKSRKTENGRNFSDWLVMICYVRPRWGKNVQ